MQDRHLQYQDVLLLTAQMTNCPATTELGAPAIVPDGADQVSVATAVSKKIGR